LKGRPLRAGFVSDLAPNKVIWLSALPEWRPAIHQGPQGTDPRPTCCQLCRRLWGRV